MTTKPLDCNDVFRIATDMSGDTDGLIYVGAQIIAAIDRLTRATTRQTAVLRTDPLEDRDLVEAAVTEARAASCTCRGGPKAGRHYVGCPLSDGDFGS